MKNKIVIVPHVCPSGREAFTVHIGGEYSIVDIPRGCAPGMIRRLAAVLWKLAGRKHQEANREKETI